MALLWKMICNLGDPMSLRHPVLLGVLVCVAFFVASYISGVVHVHVWKNPNELSANYFAKDPQE